MTFASVSSLPLNGTFPPYYPFYQDCFGTHDWWETSSDVSSSPREVGRMFKGKREWHFYFIKDDLFATLYIKLIANMYLNEGGWDCRWMESSCLGVWDSLGLGPGSRMHLEIFFIPFYAWYAFGYCLYGKKFLYRTMSHLPNWSTSKRIEQ